MAPAVVFSGHYIHILDLKYTIHTDGNDFYTGNNAQQVRVGTPLRGPRPMVAAPAPVVPAPQRAAAPVAPAAPQRAAPPAPNAAALSDEHIFQAAKQASANAQRQQQQQQQQQQQPVINQQDAVEVSCFV